MSASLRCITEQSSSLCCAPFRYFHGIAYSEDDYAEDFRKAMSLLTKDATHDFKVSLSLYYLEHDPDLHVTFDRQELAARDEMR